MSSAEITRELSGRGGVINSGDMIIYLLALLLGVITGLRALTPLAVMSWAARLGALHLQDTWAAFLGFAFTPYLLSILALGELFNDKLPTTPSRRAPLLFGVRVVLGAFGGAVLGLSRGLLPGGLAAGAAGAVIGTLVGYELRTRLAKAIGGKDLPIALLEDVIAVGSAIAIVSRLS